MITHNGTNNKSQPHSLLLAKKKSEFVENDIFKRQKLRELKIGVWNEI